MTADDLEIKVAKLEKSEEYILADIYTLSKEMAALSIENAKRSEETKEALYVADKVSVKMEALHQNLERSMKHLEELTAEQGKMLDSIKHGKVILLLQALVLLLAVLIGTLKLGVH